MSAEVVYRVSPYCAQNASFIHIPFCINSNSFVSQDCMDICCFHSSYKMSWTLFSNEFKCSLVISRDLVYSITRTKYVILIDMLHCTLNNEVMLLKTFHQLFELTLRNYHTCVRVITFPSKQDINLIEYTSHRRGIEPASLVMRGNLFKDFFFAERFNGSIGQYHSDKCYCYPDYGLTSGINNLFLLTDVCT